MHSCDCASQEHRTTAPPKCELTSLATDHSTWLEPHGLTQPYRVYTLHHRSVPPSEALINLMFSDDEPGFSFLHVRPFSTSLDFSVVIINQINNIILC